MPVGRIEYVHLGPMTFEEYLSEIDDSLLKYIIEFDFSEDIPTTVQKKMLARQREYLLVGGMPEAILNYLRSGQFSDIIPVHRSIISTYPDDYSKYATEKALTRRQKVKPSQRPAGSTSVITFDFISLPLYMVGQLARIIGLYRNGSLTVFPQNRF